MGAFTWGRIAAAAGLGLVAAGVVYVTRTEKGRQLAGQVRDRALELWEKTRQGEDETTTLPESPQTALGPRTGIEEQPTPA